MIGTYIHKGHINRYREEKRFFLTSTEYPIGISGNLRP